MIPDAAPSSRRQFIRDVGLLGLAAVCIPARAQTESSKAGGRKMTLNLVCGNIGVSANQTQAIDLAYRHGFESVEPSGEYLANLSDQQTQDLLADMKQKNIRFGAAGLPVDFRATSAKFEDGLKRLPKIAAGLQRAGATRVGTWVMPCSDTLTYLQHFRQQAERLRAIARILGDHGQKFGLEYVGTPSIRSRKKYPFVHCMAEMRELIAEIGTGNVGLVLDSWHWWTARDTEADILSLKNEDVVAVDLNDAPAGIPLEQQMDGRRELPCATGVIDAGVFLNALNKIGYDGPVRAEPFNKAVNDLDNDVACEVTIQALKKAFALIHEG